MPETIQLSVVVPTWNAAELTSRTIEHLNRDGLPGWAELIVVNDGSDDDTSTHIRTQHPRVRVIDHDRNRGFGASINTGFRTARGRCLSALNNDALATWTGLRDLARFLQSRSQAAAVAPQILNEEGARQRVGFDIPGLPWERIPRRSDSNMVRDAHLNAVEPYEAGYLKGACLVFAREALEAVGLFDEQFHMFAEEIDLFRRLSRSGWKAWVVPAVNVVHAGGVTSRNHKDPRVASRFRIRSHRSMCIYYKKHHSWTTAALLRGILAARISGRILRSPFPSPLTKTGPRREVMEHLSCLAAVLRPCSSMPIEPPLAPRDERGPDLNPEELGWQTSTRPTSGHDQTS